MSGATERIPLAPEDAARLHMGMRSNPMIIVVVLLLAAPVNLERLTALLARRLPAHFRQRIAPSRAAFGAEGWVSAEDFDATAHVHQLNLGTRALRDIVSELASAPLPADRPLWDAHLALGERCALVFRIHHAIADGAGLLEVLAGLDDTPVAAPGVASSHTPVRLVDRAWQMLLGARSAATLLLQPADPPSILHVQLGARKRLAFSDAMDLRQVVAEAHASGVGMMVGVLAAVTDALRDSLPSCSRPGATLHALVPVPLGAREASDAGNRFASVFVALPTGETDRDARVRAIDAALRRARQRVPAAAHVIEAAGIASAAIERLGVVVVSRKASVMVSNVRGPEQRVHIDGVDVTDVVAFAPAPGRIALGITLMSYAGRIRVGVALDANVPARSREIAARLEYALTLSHAHVNA